jgi:hypothetical protein
MRKSPPGASSRPADLGTCEALSTRAARQPRRCLEPVECRAASGAPHAKRAPRSLLINRQTRYRPSAAPAAANPTSLAGSPATRRNPPARTHGRSEPPDTPHTAPHRAPRRRPPTAHHGPRTAPTGPRAGSRPRARGAPRSLPGASALGARSQSDKSDPGDADPALWILPGGIADGGARIAMPPGRQCSPVGRKRLGVRTAELEPNFSVVSAFLHMRVYPQMRWVAPRRPQWVGGALVRQQHRGRNAVARRGVLSPRLTTSPRPARRRMYLQPCKPS